MLVLIIPLALLVLGVIALLWTVVFVFRLLWLTLRVVAAIVDGVGWAIGPEMTFLCLAVTAAYFALVAAGVMK